ncbi:hypothetical protein N2152v2_007018 [Parachlorella kessleri]
MVTESQVEQPPQQAEPLKNAQLVLSDSSEDAAAGNGAHENGHKDDPGAQQQEAGATSNGEPAEEELWRKRLWFVRIPRPPELVAVKALEQEQETYRAQYKLLTESFNVKKVERDAARENTRAAREAFKASKEAFERKRAIVQPFREAEKSTSGDAKKLRESFSELEARSEAELDERLQQLHYRIEHESIPLNEEKRILQLIRKLESQRPKVREYEAQVGTLAEARAAVKQLEGDLADHKEELKVLQGEKDTQWTILEKFREQEQVLDKEVEEILAERRRFKELMDEAYTRVAELKSLQKAKNDEFYANRRFSKTIREASLPEVLAAGNLDEARRQCAEQMEEAHAKLSADPDYRAEYFVLWDQQRKSPVSMAALDDDIDLPAAAAGKGGKGGKQHQQRDQPPLVDPAVKAEQVIAAVLEEAKGSIMRVKAAAASAAAAAAVAPALAEPEAATVAAEPESAAAKLAAAAKPPKPRKAEAPRHLVMVPVLPPDNFQLPESIKGKKAPSAEELKELEREHNRQAQVEAERRKQRKQQEREKKRQRALQDQQARAKQAAAAAVAVSGGSEGQTPVDSDAAPEQSGDESGAEKAAAVLPLPQQGSAAATTGPVQPTAAGKAATKTSRVSAAAKAKAVGKRPAATKKPLGKLVRSYYKEYQMHFAVGAVLAVMLVLLLLFLTTPSKAK